MNKNSISIILPCFNESGNIIPLIEKIHSKIKNIPHEIIVVDDNSPDNTYQIVKDANFNFVRLILRTSDPSLGKSIRAGIEASKNNIIIVMDSDFNHLPEDLPALIDNLKYFDCVLASRFIYGGKMTSRFRHICSWLFNMFSRILTKTQITDSLFGYYAIKKSILEQLEFDAIFYGYGDYCIRLMYYLQKNQVTILQIPGIIGKRLSGEGNSKLLKTLAIYTKEVLKLLFKTYQGNERKHVSRNKSM